MTSFSFLTCSCIAGVNVKSQQDDMPQTRNKHVQSPPIGKGFHLVVKEAQLSCHLVGALDLRTAPVSPWPQAGLAQAEGPNGDYAT